MTVYSLYIINKAGGLAYQKDYTQGLARLTSNEYLVLAGTFHSVHAITSKISPTSGTSTGIEVLEADTFTMYNFQTLTGTKFILVTAPSHGNIGGIMQRIYEIYADYVMKNPFHAMEMPIRSENFDLNINNLIKSL